MSERAIATNITKLIGQVRDAAENFQRDPNSVQIMAVSKTQPDTAVREAAQAGLSHFGENYLQEAMAKIEACRDLDLSWHFIGPIQSNKTRSIATHFDWVHSIDRLKVLQRLSEHRPESKGDLNICIQVNISGEATKSGCAPEVLPELMTEAASLPRLTLRGLMSIPAPASDFMEQRAACDQLAVLFEQQKEQHPALDTLSIGMSADLEAAIASGSTMLRIGTAIFGPRRR